MKKLVFETSNNYAPLVMRLLLGLVIFPHGAQKLFGWYGGYGFSGTMGFLTETVGLPGLIAFMVIILESFGALALLAGIGTRIISAMYIILATGIVLSSHVKNGFFMNWFGNQAGEGYEFHLLWIALSISLLLLGGGKFSADRLFYSREKIQ